MKRAVEQLWKGAAVLAAALALGAAAPEPDLTLTGVMTGADHETYREVPFRVPPGVTQVTVDFAYTGREQRSVIDLGLRDPQQFRGWSGGNKSRFTVAETFATPSYLPGPLPSGQWRLILGVPNLRKDARASYAAKIFFTRGGRFEGFAPAPLKTGEAWYRGDLHMHSAHSDGSCASRKGAKVPCPLFRTTEAAAARGLDFVAVTEHNATSHHQGLAELQPYYDDLLLIPGREITTFKGHANVFGVVAPLDFQLGGPRAPGLGRIQDQVEAAGGLISINHPGLPSGEACMGCGWTGATDFARISAVEAVNGATVDTPLSGIPFWEARLNAGFRITAIGGSDNHDPGLDPSRPPAIGAPTTVVRAGNLSQNAILDAIRAGAAFVDVAGTRDRLLEVTATSAGAEARMGEVLAAPAGRTIRLQVRVTGAAGGRIAIVGDVERSGPTGAPLSADETRTLDVISHGRPGWVRADVRGPDGKLWLLGNPIYLNRP